MWIVPPGGQSGPARPVSTRSASSTPKGLGDRQGHRQSLFREVNGGVLPDRSLCPRDARQPRRRSNVNATAALVNMIEASRAWENQIKLIQTAKEIDSGGASLMRRGQLSSNEKGPGQ